MNGVDEPAASTPLDHTGRDGRIVAYNLCNTKIQREDLEDDGAARGSAARGSVKKLRYLLEGLKTIPRGLPAPSDLRDLQSALGQAHDREMIAADIAAVGRAAALRLPARHVLRRLLREKKDLLSGARRHWKSLLEPPGAL